MSKLSLGLSLIVLIFATACSNATKEVEEGLSLNKGQKWEVNTEMQAPIAKAEERLQYFLDKGEGDYKSLASDLKEYNQKLIQSCTMKGESHEELHKWLHPHLDLVKDLSSAEKPKEGQAIVKQLQGSFETYHQYFQ